MVAISSQGFEPVLWERRDLNWTEFNRNCTRLERLITWGPSRRKGFFFFFFSRVSSASCGVISKNNNKIHPRTGQLERKRRRTTRATNWLCGTRPLIKLSPTDLLLLLSSMYYYYYYIFIFFRKKKGVVFLLVDWSTDLRPDNNNIVVHRKTKHLFFSRTYNIRHI